MREIILNFVSLFVENICFFIISKAFIARNNGYFLSKTASAVGLGLSGSILMTSFSYLFSNPMISSILFIPVQIIMLVIFYKAKIRDFVIIYALEYLIIIGCLQSPIDLILSLLSAANIYILNIICNIITLIFCMIIYLFVPLEKLQQFLDKQNFITKILTINSAIIAIILALYFKSSDNIFYVNLFYILISILTILIINVLLISSRDKIDSQRKELEAYNCYMPIIEQLISEVRQRQHNHDNHIQAIKMLPAAYGTYEELCSALTDYADHMITDNISSGLLKLNLKLVSGFLFSKCNEAAEHNKTLSIHVNNFQLTTAVPEYILIDLIGILTDNAIEAVPDGETAHIHLDSINNKITIKTSNPGPVATPQFIDMITRSGYTTKQSADGKPHGLGLPGLLTLIKKYDGELTIDNETINHMNYICFKLEI